MFPPCLHHDPDMSLSTRSRRRLPSVQGYGVVWQKGTSFYISWQTASWSLEGDSIKVLSSSRRRTSLYRISWKVLFLKGCHLGDCHSKCCFRGKCHLLLLKWAAECCCECHVLLEGRVCCECLWHQSDCVSCLPADMGHDSCGVLRPVAVGTKLCSPKLWQVCCSTCTWRERKRERR